MTYSNDNDSRFDDEELEFFEYNTQSSDYDGEVYEIEVDVDDTNQEEDE